MTRLSPLEVVAAWADEDEPAKPMGVQRGSPDLQVWMQRHADLIQVGVTGPHPKDGGIVYKLQACPFQPDYAGGNASVMQQADGTLGFHCFCGDHEKKTWRDFRELIEGPRARGEGERRLIPSVEALGSIRTFAAQEIRYVLDGMVAEGTLNMLSGDAGSGKTTLATAICHAVANGLPFAGRPTSKRPVLYLDRENPLSVVVERCDRLGVSDSEDFRIWGGWQPEEAPGPESTIVQAWISRCDPKPVIVVDSFISFHPGSENDSTETRRYMSGFRRLTDFGATVILLHHTGKGETAQQYRGSSDIKASVDIAYHVANMGDSTRLGVLRLKAFKSRFAVETDISFRYVDGQFLPDERRPMDTVTDSLVRLLQGHGGIRGSEFEALALEKGLGRDRARRFLADGIASKRIIVTRGERNARFHTWSGERQEASDDLF